MIYIYSKVLTCSILGVYARTRDSSLSQSQNANAAVSVMLRTQKSQLPAFSDCSSAGWVSTSLATLAEDGVSSTCCHKLLKAHQLACRCWLRSYNPSYNRTPDGRGTSPIAGSLALSVAAVLAGRARYLARAGVGWWPGKNGRPTARSTSALATFFYIFCGNILELLNKFVLRARDVV